MAKKLLSVVVPAYKQERSIKGDLEHIDKTLKTGLPGDFDFEIICVVDGNVDDTERQAKKLKSESVRVLAYKSNRGKGFAVRYGMKKANGDLVAFIDAGREINPTSIMMLMAHMKWYNADIIVGSKRHPVSQVSYPMSRKIISLGYHLGTRVLLGVGVKDTQSGIKIFKKEVIDKILPRLLVKTYAMDIEMLAVAKYCGFGRIYEAPIQISYKFENLTSAATLGTIFRMAQDTLAVFYRLKIKHYYDDKNKANWLGDKDF